MLVIAGLGNPKKEYNNTRHNIGFETIDYIAKENEIKISEKKHKALIGRGTIKGQQVLLVKPQTYMNLSGDSLKQVADFYKVDVSKEMIIIYDDVALPVGQLRIRKTGTAGGHNGMRSIINQLGTKDFLRIRMGVGEKPESYDLADYVLGHFTKKEKIVMEDCIMDANTAIQKIVQGDVDFAMNAFNKKKENDI